MNETPGALKNGSSITQVPSQEVVTPVLPGFSNT
jgi:hypothetical protein